MELKLKWYYYYLEICIIFLVYIYVYIYIISLTNFYHNMTRDNILNKTLAALICRGGSQARHGTTRSHSPSRGLQVDKKNYSML